MLDVVRPSPAEATLVEGRKGFGERPFSASEYVAWFQRYETVTNFDKGAIAAHIADLPSLPDFLIVVDIDIAVSDDVVEQALGSLQHQLLRNWVAIIVHQGSDNRRIVEKCSSLSKHLNDRLLVLTKEEAEAIYRRVSENRNSFTVLMPINYVLNCRFLYEVAVAATNAPHAIMFYTDEDTLSLDNQQSDPIFKIGWNSERFLCDDYLGSCLVVRSDALFRVVGSLGPINRASAASAILEVASLFGDEAIVHIPRPIAHRHPVFRRQDDFLQVINATRNWVQKHCPGAEVTLLSGTSSVRRIKWPAPSRSPLISIIVPTKDRVELLANCVSGVLCHTSYSNIELIICDNGSEDEATLAYFESLSQENRVKILPMPGEFNFSDLNNRAVAQSSGELLLFLNNDIEIIYPEWLDELVSHALRPNVGAVGAKLLYPDGRIQHAGIIAGPKDDVWHPWRLSSASDPGYQNALIASQRLLAVTGACLAMRREVFLSVGGFNAVDFKVAYNDVDLCLRVRERGFDIVWTPHAILLHHESVSRGQNADTKNQATALRERKCFAGYWARVIDKDSNLNPNTRITWDDGLILAAPRHSHSWRDYLNPHKHPCAADPGIAQGVRDERLLAIEFDANWYRGRYSDLLHVDDAFAHFMRFGHKEGRDPNQYFSTKAYTDRYDDVRYSGTNAFSHYCDFGFREGRNPFG